MFAVCGTVWCGFGGVSLCCVLVNFVFVCGSECVLCVGQFGFGFGGVSLCCVWDSFVWVWVSECVLCVGQFCVGLAE